MRMIDADFACKGCIRYRTSLPCEECVVNDASPVDAVTVVRCREWKKHGLSVFYPDRLFCLEHRRYVDPDGYCYLGERKRGADNG